MIFNPVDVTKPVRTRDGRPARIICSDRSGPNVVCPIVALVTTRDGNEIVCHYYADGCKLSPECLATHSDDLVNIPEKVKLWAVIADERPGGVQMPDDLLRLSYAYLFKDRPTNPRMVSGIGSRVIACLEVEFEEGAGLSA